MRIGNHTMVDRALRDLSLNKVRVANVQRDITTGKRIHRGADDPTAAARAHALRETLANNQTYAGNVDAARDFLATTDEALGRYHDALLKIRSIAVQGASGTLQQSDKQVLSTQLKEMREIVRLAGNSRTADGRYVFGGLKTASQSQTEPYPAADVTLGANEAGLMQVEVAQGSTMTYNVTGVAAFGDTTPPNDTHVFAISDELDQFLTNGTNNRDITDTSLAKIDTQLDTVTRLRTDVGSRVQRLDLMKTRYEDFQVELEGMLEDTEGTDIAQASLRLNQYDAAFKSALAVGARALPMSLVDFLR